MQRSKQINITGTFQNLNTLVQAAIIAAGEPALQINSFHTLTIRNDRSNTAGNRIQLSFDFINDTVDAEILVEDEKAYSEGGKTNNSASMLDKQIRMVDGSDVATTGTATIIMEWS